MLYESTTTFINYKRSRGCTDSTCTTYRYILDDFIEFTGDIALESLTINLIDLYVNTLQSVGLKPKTIYSRLAVIRSLVLYLYSRDLTNIRPQAVELPKLADTEANYLLPDEQTRLLSVIDNQRDKAVIHTLISSGLRVSELANLLYDDIENKSIVVRKGNGQKHRVTFITEACRSCISAYLSSKPRTVYLFTNLQGDPLSRQFIYKIVKQYALKAGIEKEISPHTLRHTFATNLLRNGARVETVQPLMGHANIQTTLIYAHFTNPYLQSEYDKFSTV